MKSCDKCIHFGVCKLQKDTSNMLPNFIDFDKGNPSEWLLRFWAILAERCNYFKEKDET